MRKYPHIQFTCCVRTAE